MSIFASSRSSTPCSPSNGSDGPSIPRIAKNAASTPPRTALGRVICTHVESEPVELDERLIPAVAAIESALRIRSSSSLSARETPAAAATALCIVGLNPAERAWTWSHIIAWIS